MPTDVKLPQMGESIYEGTITKWLKKEGDTVRKDEPLYELSTDKVDSEIPSPVSGRIAKIVVQAGQKVPIHTVVAQVEEGAGGGGEKAAPAAPKPAEKAPEKPAPKPAAETRPTARTEAPPPPAAEPAADGDERTFASPLVRKIAKDENVDLTNVRGSGPGGRITKEDILAHVERRRGAPTQVGRPAPAAAPQGQAPAPAPAAARPQSAPMAPAAPRFAAGDRTHVEPMSPMRAKISEHMVMSKRTSAHVASVFEADMTRIVKLREREKEEYETVHGVKLTYTPFFAVAAIQALKEFPIINSSVDGNNIVYKRDINLGIAVALPDGLIVPVVHRADELSFLGLARSINDLAERARTRKLKVEEVQGGTFTITNPGPYGNLYGIPIINQPQVAIMGTGGIEKRPIVVDDAIAIRWMVYFSMSYDHRIVDGAVADQFMARVKKTLQEWNQPIQ